MDRSCRPSFHSSSICPHGHAGLHEFAPQTLQSDTNPALDRALGLSELGRPPPCTCSPPKYASSIASRSPSLQRLHRLANVSGERHVPHFAGDVVATLGLLACLALLAIAARRRRPGSGRRIDRGSGRGDSCAACHARGRTGSGSFQSRTNTSCTISSARAWSLSSRLASPKTAPALRRYASASAACWYRPIDTTSAASEASVYSVSHQSVRSRGRPPG